MATPAIVMSFCLLAAMGRRAAMRSFTSDTRVRGGRSGSSRASPVAGWMVREMGP